MDRLFGGVVLRHSRPDVKHCAIIRANRGGAASEKTSRLAKALEDYSRAIELEPETPDAWNGRARCHFRLKDYDRARADLAEFVRLGGQPHPDLVKALSAAESH